MTTPPIPPLRAAIIPVTMMTRSSRVADIIWATRPISRPAICDASAPFGPAAVSAELAAYVAAEIPKWAALARQAGVKPE